MNNPVFSIITITYNASQVLEPTLMSVIEQNYPFIEYIMIDGGSTDKTMDLVNNYREHIKYVVSEPDNGLYDAMNKGLRVATGNYVWFINAGDALHTPHTVSDLVKSLNASLAKGMVYPDILYGETALVDKNRMFTGMRRLHAPEKLNWRSFQKGMLVCHQSFIVRRTLAPEYDLSYRFSSDFVRCIRCMKKAHHIWNSRQILIDYLDEGLTTKNRKESLKERFRIMCRYYGYPIVVISHLWFAIRFSFARLMGKEK